MANNIRLHINLIVLSTTITLYLINRAIANADLNQRVPEEYSWIVHGIVNILSYATIFLPGYITFKYIRSINYKYKGENCLCLRSVHTCFGEEESVTNPTTTEPTATRSNWNEILVILVHFFGLQFSYLTWGLLQEKVMTQEYQSNSGEKAHFKDSQFLVFVNRVLAFLMSGAYILYKRQMWCRCPLYKYSFCSFSNIMSSWCQYEALKYVSFPHQVLAKSAKTIPVMIMGKILSKTKYERYEYVTSVILSIGMLMFMLDVGNDRSTSVSTTLSGVFLLVLYIVFDSFTSNWQGALFKSYYITPIQMMCFVNLYSCVFTFMSLLQQGAFFASIDFMFKYPQFIIDCIVLSLCSATGQFFIFSTIAKFGPLIFAVITTIRQGFSVLLSCIVYNHAVSVSGILGLFLVFLSILLRIYFGHRIKVLRRLQNSSMKPQKILI